MGVEVVATITGDGRIDDICRSHGAALNVVQCSGSMARLAAMMEEKYGIPSIRVSYFGIEDMSKALYDVATFFKDKELFARTSRLVKENVQRVMAGISQFRKVLTGKRAAIYVGGAFKAFSLVRSLRTLGIKTVVVGSQTGNKQDYDQLHALCDEGTIIVDDTNPLELSELILRADADLLIGGVKERPIAYKLGIGFVDHNHERKIALAGYEGMLNFAREVHTTVMSPIWNLVPRHKKTDDHVGRGNHE
jgi:nitrogenase molybdenum-cofactor synthesis protein NifE